MNEFLSCKVQAPGHHATDTLLGANFTLNKWTTARSLPEEVSIAGLGLLSQPSITESTVTL